MSIFFFYYNENIHNINIDIRFNVHDEFHKFSVDFRVLLEKCQCKVLISIFFSVIVKYSIIIALCLWFGRNTCTVSAILRGTVPVLIYR